MGAILIIFKNFIIILIVSTNYIFVHLLDNKVFLNTEVIRTNYKVFIYSPLIFVIAGLELYLSTT